MSEEIKKLRCPDCGALYTPSAKTCRSCGKTLPREEQSLDSEMLEGMPIKDWHTFIGKNSDYYVRTFKKHEGKAFFLSLNPAAVIFRIPWVFYRKMYKFGILLLSLILIISCFVGILIMAANMPEIKQKKAVLLSYSEYIDLDGIKTSKFYEDKNISDSAISAYSSYKKIVSSTTTKAMVIGVLASVGTIMILNLFFSDWVYREHILNRTVRRNGYIPSSGEGGTTLWPAIILQFTSDYLSTACVYVIIKVITAMV